jgi:hypothetical protein
MHFDDEAFTEELLEKLIERYWAEGYEIKSDSGSGVDLRYIDFQGNERTFSMRAYCLTDYVIEMNIPLIGK